VGAAPEREEEEREEPQDLELVESGPSLEVVGEAPLE
jgi:hypothetical protein